MSQEVSRRSTTGEPGQSEIVAHSERAMAVAGYWTRHIIGNVTSTVPEFELSIDERLQMKVDRQVLGSSRYSRSEALSIPETLERVRLAVHQNSGVFMTKLALALDADRFEEMFRFMGTDKYNGLRRPYTQEQRALAEIAHSSGIPQNAFPLGLATFTTGYGTTAVIEGRTREGAPVDVVFPAVSSIGAESE